MFERVQTLAFQRGRLPHWLVSDHSFFVTLCRKGCLPNRVVTELRQARNLLATQINKEALKTTHQEPASCRPSRRSGPTAGDTPLVARAVPDRDASCDEQALILQRRHFLQVEAILDATARSNRDLCEPDIASIIFKSLEWLRERKWRIWAATLMPSHMHLVLRHVDGENGALRNDLTRVMRFTARQVNGLRGLAGAFWQSEPFDHWCRDHQSWLRSIAYTLNNPVKGHLCAAWREWHYSWVDPEAVSIIDGMSTPPVARGVPDRDAACDCWPSRRSGPTAGDTPPVARAVLDRDAACESWPSRRSGPTNDDTPPVARAVPDRVPAGDSWPTLRSGPTDAHHAR